MTDRCEVCGWPLAASRKEGCVAGDCSMRPVPLCQICGRMKGQPPARCNEHHVLIPARDTVYLGRQ